MEANMKDKELKVMKSRVLEAYNNEDCSEGRAILRALFPDVFKKKLKYALGEDVKVSWDARIIEIDEDDEDTPYKLEQRDGYRIWTQESCISPR